MTPTFRLLFLLAALGVSPARAADIPVVAAASDLKFALEEAAESFAKASGRSVKLTFGSSGNLARQIQAGAPFELFLSADEDYVRLLARTGRTEGEGVLYGIGRLVVFAPIASSVTTDSELAGLSAALASGGVRRLALANPEHAPYGRAARQALEATGLWSSAMPRLVLGENVSQAAQFARSGAVDAALFAYSLALTPAFAGKGRYALVDERLHAPLKQRMVLLSNAGGTARAFYDFLQSHAAKRILERYGFAVSAQQS